ncbi:hypothetical protein JTE90_000600 [Oedothorax gibbosus]|uniref:Peptidase M24 domain-containing protein n=1 Tax=Oedothorax gibbosus TaxID=931172 RepID=A0AAV6VWQ9_9ARAC|nr:hypothetical protein JTE90_000600 [Oedothorax gibbosus]
MNLDTAINFLGVDRALYLDDFENFLQSFSKSNKQFTIWYDHNRAPFPKMKDKILEFLHSISGRFALESSRHVLHTLRVIKCDAEAQLMRETCKIGALSMKEVMKFSHVDVAEAHLLAKMEYECRMRGANYLAFPPVVAGGDRANTIHYIDSNNIVKGGDMVLMDSGCEYHGYSSDISRTWPVDGKFTDPQRELYQVVLAVQEDLIQLCQTKVPLDNLFEIMCKNLGKAFQKLGVIPKSATEHHLKEAGYELCPHHVGHYLGMDVHDTELISRGIKLQAGMVVTIEPGIYISKSNTKYPEKYRGQCIRIEDDVLITEDGYEVLTADCPKSIHDIEDLCKK